MKRIRKLAAIAAVVALALAPLPASAATTTIRRDYGPLYSGKVKATLIAPVLVTNSLGVTICNVGSIGGSVQWDGTALNVSSFAFSNNPGPLCPNSSGGSTTVSEVGLPWIGGTVVYGNSLGGNAVVTLQNVKVSWVATGWFGTISCTYRGSGAGNSIALALYNYDNPNRPVPSVVQAQASTTSYPLNKDSGGLLCPSTATFSATFSLLGEIVANSGVFNQRLYISP